MTYREASLNGQYTLQTWQKPVIQMVC